MPVFATAGSTVYIGGAHAMPTVDLTTGDFSGETWTEIKNVESIGTFGDQSELVDVSFTNDPGRRQRTIKGLRSAGDAEFVMGIDYADAGQLALIAAEKTTSNYAFKIVFNDAPSGGTPSERYFVALVSSATEALDSANNVMKLNSSVRINSNIVRVAAAEA